MNGIKKFYEKNVVVRFIDEDNQAITVTGVLTEFTETNDEDENSEDYVIIESDTDYDRILVRNIKKIYLKE